MRWPGGPFPAVVMDSVVLDNRAARGAKERAKVGVQRWSACAVRL